MIESLRALHYYGARFGGFMQICPYLTLLELVRAAVKQQRRSQDSYKLFRRGRQSAIVRISLAQLLIDKGFDPVVPELDFQKLVDPDSKGKVKCTIEIDDCQWLHDVYENLSGIIKLRVKTDIQQALQDPQRLLHSSQKYIELLSPQEQAVLWRILQQSLHHISLTSHQNPEFPADCLPDAKLHSYSVR